ncbi:proteoglycan 4b isoform X2 [Paralichthys olivaceus]|uniref:proteoglycan 4b isoform X2 n=1 Tax=Paralichthys olivaceus TaxID=8255 RepID=UPI0037515CB3
MKMSSTLLCAVIFLACALTLSAAQTSCKGRCGAEYYRGYMCQCDYTCLLYGECCEDYESQCTTKNSCKGRCGETFKRGRRCTCDTDCFKFNQCCPDYTSHCDAEEEISGAASATAPVKTSSCDSVNIKKPTEPPLMGPEQQASTFSEGNNADTNNLLPPDDEFTNTGQEETSPVPEGTSGYGSSTADDLDHVSTEPTLQSVTVITQTEMTQTDDGPTIYMTSGDAPTESTGSSDPGTTLPQATTAAEQVSNQPTPTSAAQTEVSATASSPEPETAGQGTVQPEDDVSPAAQTTHLPEASSDNAEVTTLPFTTAASASTELTQDDRTVVMSQSTTVPITVPASSTLDLTTIPDATTSYPDPQNTESSSEDSTTGPQDPSTSGSPELDAPTTHIPSSTSAAQDGTTDEVTPQVTTADPVRVTPDSTEQPQPSKPTEQPQPSTPTEQPQPSTPTEQPQPSKPTEQPQPSKPTEQPQPSKPTEQPQPSKPTEQPQPSKPTKQPQNNPLPAKPTVVNPPPKDPETKPVDAAQTLTIDNPGDYQADDSNDTNLCSGRPVGAVTTLRNGTVVVFRGHYFWFLNRHREPGPARGITQVWGVPSPIDTVFTRCSCQGKTYIFKGSEYWRYENDVLDRGYPKVIETGFDGLRGHITAALSVPQYQRRRESVYFFKRGGLVQKYSYQLGTSQSCGRKAQHAVYTVRNRVARQAVSLLGPVINIRTSWRGFPTTVTAAVSVPNTREPEGYKYYVFSRSKSYNLRLDGERPAIAATTANVSPQSNDLFKCPKI